ncbi:MAG: hypothetical protein Kow0029_02180 [Candidatus Rifleibacteriota bacterium]
MDDYAINFAYLKSDKPDEQMQGLAFFAVIEEKNLDEKTIERLIELAETGSAHVSDIASSIISQAVATREQHAVAELVLKKLRNANESQISLRDLEWAIKLKSEKFKIALEKYLDRCTDPKHISWLVKNLPQAYPDPEQLPLLKSFLTYSDDRIVANALEGIESLDIPETIPIYAQMLSHPSHRVRSVAAAAIARVNPQQARNLLFTMLNQKDQPESVKAACHAIRHIKSKGLMDLVLPLLQNRATRDEAARTVAFLAYQRLAKLFTLPVFANRNDLKSRVAAYIIELLREQCRRQFHLSTDDEDSPEQGTCQLILGEKGYIMLNPKISAEKADQIAEENKHRGINFFTRLIYRPKPEEIKLTRSEARYEPFWQMVCEAKIDYVREKSIHLNLDDNVCELKIGDQYFKANKGKAFVNIDERCVIRKKHDFYVDAVTGDKRDLSELMNTRFSRIASIDEIINSDFTPVYPRIKASILVRDMIIDTMKPLKAIEIIAQSLKIEKLNLCFRPVYAYEFSWKAKDKTVVFEVCGITGKVSEGKVKTSEKFDEFLSDSNIFDIGADAIGLVIPGGEIAAKIAKAIIGKKN